MNFTELGLKDELLQAINEMGFETPMPIQEQAIPALLGAPTDFVGLAQTGTGKTGAYGLPMLQRIDPAMGTLQALVVCPTRELCMQITQELRQFGRHLKGFRAVAVYGGASISYQVSEVRRGSQVVVATPGRLLDLMQRGAVRLDGVLTAVLDEADEMLNMGFQEDINTILKALPPAANTWMFSATMSQGVAAIARKYLKDPVEITIGTRNQSAANIEHVCYTVHPGHRYASLKRIIDLTPDIFGLVFRRTRRDAQELAESLNRDGYPAEALHGDLSQAQRDSVMRRFRQGQVRLLVATDVAARGLDVEDITHIVHYDLPDDMDVYTHRSGRTARAGKSGASIVFISPADRHRIGHLERRLRIRFTAGKVPDGREISRRRLLEMAGRLVATPVDAGVVAEFLPAVEEALHGLSREEILARLVAAELQRTQGATVDLNAPLERSRREAEPFRESAPMQALEIDAGRVDRINEGAIVRFVCEYGGVTSAHIGRITMRDRATLFEVRQDVAGQVMKGVAGAPLDGRPVRIRESAGRLPAGRHERFHAHPSAPRPHGHRPYHRFRVHERK